MRRGRPKAELGRGELEGVEGEQRELRASRGSKWVQGGHPPTHPGGAEGTGPCQRVSRSERRMGDPDGKLRLLPR